MVGVAGKSQACNTCKQRRVKCDFGRPSCLKCIGSNRACTGYERDTVFVNRTPSCSTSTATSVLSELRAQQRLKHALPDSTTELTLHTLFLNSPQNVQDFRNFAVQLLKNTYLPKQPVSSILNAETSEGAVSWVYRLTELNEPSKSLDTAIFAFCLAQLYVSNAGNVSLHQCLERYNNALQYLYSDLDDPERRIREETLAAILVLITCELFICPTENGWSVHTRGIAKILQLRDPRTASSPAWRHLASRLRVVCTLESLTKRQARFLEKDIWQQGSHSSGFCHALNEVYHIISDVPSVLERAVNLISINDQNILLKESATVVQSALAMIKSVELWHHEFLSASQTPRYWLVPSFAANPADSNIANKIFPVCFEFESLSAAQPVVMYWSVAAQLYSNVIQVYDLLQARLSPRIELEDLLAQADPVLVDAASTVGVSGQSILLSATDKTHSIQDIRSEGTRIARYICQSMEYHHRIELGTYGGQATTYPSWSARQYFRLHPGHEREWSWLQNMHKMEGPGTRWGLSMMAFADIAEPLSGVSI